MSSTWLATVFRLVRLLRPRASRSTRAELRAPARWQHDVNQRGQRDALAVAFPHPDHRIWRVGATHRNPLPGNGKEGVSGSSPEEGFWEIPAHGAICCLPRRRARVSRVRDGYTSDARHSRAGDPDEVQECLQTGFDVGSARAGPDHPLATQGVSGHATKESQRKPALPHDTVSTSP